MIATLAVIPALYPKFQTLDTLTSYTPEKAYEHISSYGYQGRQYYATIELTLDLVYPLILALLFGLAALYTFQRAFRDHIWTYKLALIPFIGMIADYLENACVVIMLLSYPRILPIVARISNVFTIAKWALTPFELLFVVGLIGWLVQVIRRRRPPITTH